MKTELIVIAQARPIAGRRRDPHVCTILLDPEAEKLYRVTFEYAQSPRKWDRVSVNLYKASTDSRRESMFVTDVKLLSKLSKKSQNIVHKQLLNMATSEQEAVEDGRSINVTKIRSITLRKESWSKDSIHVKENSSKKGINLAPIQLRAVCTPFYEHKSPQMNRKYLEWGANYRLLTEGEQAFPGIKKAIASIKYPYLIVGNHYRHTKDFMAISVMSSPIPYGLGEQQNLFSCF